MHASAVALGKAEKLDQTRRIAELTVDDQLAALEHAALMRGKRSDLELLRLERMVVEERRALASLDAAPVENTAAPKYADELRVVFAEVRGLEGAFDELIAQIISDGGGVEADLEEDARRHIDHLRTLKAEKVAILYEKLG